MTSSAVIPIFSCPTCPRASVKFVCCCVVVALRCCSFVASDTTTEPDAMMQPVTNTNGVRDQLGCSRIDTMLRQCLLERAWRHGRLRLHVAFRRLYVLMRQRFLITEGVPRPASGRLQFAAVGDVHDPDVQPSPGTAVFQT